MKKEINEITVSVETVETIINEGRERFEEMFLHDDLGAHEQGCYIGKLSALKDIGAITEDYYESLVSESLKIGLECMLKSISEESEESDEESDDESDE